MNDPILLLHILGQHSDFSLISLMFLVAGGDLRFENVDVRQEDLGELELTEDGLVLAGWGFGRELG